MPLSSANRRFFQIQSSAGAALTTTVPKSLNSLALPAGDWLVAGAIQFTADGVGPLAVDLTGYVSTQLDAAPANDAQTYFPDPGVNLPWFVVPPQIFSSASPFTVYLNGYAVFTGDGVSAGGTLTVIEV